MISFTEFSIGLLAPRACQQSFHVLPRFPSARAIGDFNALFPARGGVFPLP